MAVCPACGSTFINVRQLGAHRRTCNSKVVAQTSGVAARTAVATTPEVVSAPVITVPVQSSTTHTSMSELARRAKNGGSWRPKDVNLVGLPSMPPAMLARDFREVHARNHMTHEQTHEQLHSNILPLKHTSAQHSYSNCGGNSSPRLMRVVIHSSGRYSTRAEAKRARVRTQYELITNWCANLFAVRVYTRNITRIRTSRIRAILHVYVNTCHLLCLFVYTQYCTYTNITYTCNIARIRGHQNCWCLHACCLYTHNIARTQTSRIRALMCVYEQYRRCSG